MSIAFSYSLCGKSVYIALKWYYFITSPNFLLLENKQIQHAITCGFTAAAAAMDNKAFSVTLVKFRLYW